MSLTIAQYVFAENGDHSTAIVPINMWQHLLTKNETSYLWKNEKQLEILE